MQKYTLVNAALCKGSIPYHKIILRMKLVIALIMISVLSVSASTYSQTLTIPKKSMDLPQFFKEINNQTGYAFLFSKEIISGRAAITIEANGTPMETVLKNVLDEMDLKYVIKYKTIIITKKPNKQIVAKATIKNGPVDENKVIFQRLRITGTVYDDEGKTLPGATIQILGKTVLKLFSDKDGEFSFNSIEADTSILASFVGYRSQNVKLVPGKANYKIVLKIIDARLKDVVVTGIFDRPKESFTGAATVITKEQLKMYGNRNLLKTIGNIDPSFDIQESNTAGSDPNALPMIEIRGSSTLPSDLSNFQGTNVRQLLNLPLFILDGFEVSEQRVLDMNQNDVESVVILKDASATASYGARGSNGVVVITSIRPDKGKLNISYSAGLNLELPDLSSYNLLNAAEKLALEKTAGLYTSSSLANQTTLDNLYNKNYKAVMEGVNTDWAKIPVQTGVGQFHSLNLSGGDSEFRYAVNASYNQIKGAMKGSLRENFNGGMQIGYTTKKVLFSNSLTVGLTNSAQSTYGNFGEYVIMNPYWSPTDDNGNYTQLSFDRTDLQTQDNIAYNGTLKDFNKSNYTVIRNNTSIDWTVAKGLRWINSLGLSKQVGGSDFFRSPSNLLFKNTEAASKGTYNKTDQLEQNYQVRSNVSYGTVFGKHSIYAGVDAQIRESKTKASTIAVKGFTSDTYSDISYASSYNGDRPSTSENTTHNMDFSGTFSYAWDGRLFVDGNYNLTGSSSFGPKSRFGKFWSIGAGYNLANEPFVKDKLPYISKFKVRGNYGVSGGVNFQPYQAMTTYDYDRLVTYRGLTGSTIRAFGNEALEAQNTYQLSLGMEIDLFQGWVSFIGNAYVKNTDNAITTADLSASHGFVSLVENIGKIRNSGTDLTIQSFIIRNPAKRFSWSVRAATYSNKNVLVKLSDALKAISKTYEGQNSNSKIYNEFIEGNSLDEVYVLRSPGIDASTGQALYLDANGLVTTTVSGYSKVAVGNSQPKLNGRLSTTVGYKGFTATIGFAARFGGKKLNQTLLFKVENANVINNVDRRVLDLRWQKPGDVTGFKALGNVSNTTYANDRFVFTENTITLNNVNLSYDIPQKWVKKLDMSRISISATMSDLFYWSNIEQERGTEYPYSLKPSFTLSCNF